MNEIKQLREKTGVGILDCKKALEQSNGDMGAAIEFLRKKGIAKADKRKNRETTEGVIKVGLNNTGNIGYILELNSETDFVSKNQKFQDLATKIFNLAKEKNPNTIEELNSLDLDTLSVSDEINSFSGIVGEKIKINKFSVLNGKSVGAYSHMGGKIGVLVALNQENNLELANDIAMHIAASNPEYITKDEVAIEKIEKEKEIYREELINSGKPEAILDKIIDGKINKYFEEICLMNQEYIKDDKKKVEEILNGIKIDKFIRYSLV